MRYPETINDFQQKLELAKQRYQQRLGDLVHDISTQWQNYSAKPTFSNEDTKAIILALHNISGSSGTFGFSNISQIAKKCENIIHLTTEEQRKPNSEEFQTISNLIQKMNTSMHSFNASPEFTLTKYKIQQKTEHLIYLVDDDLFFNDNLSSVIRKAGFEIQCFSTLNEFRQACEHVMPTIVIMDMMFTEGEQAGADEITKLRDDFYQNFSVIFISSNKDMKSRLAAVRAGGDHYFTKPINSNNLLRTLNELNESLTQDDYRVLMVDDDKDVIAYHAVILDQKGITLEAVSNPFDVLNKIKSFKPEILILDVYMPGCSGFEMAKIIRQDEESTRIPIVFLTSESGVQTQMDGMDVGGDDYLSKPVNPEYLNRIIKARVRRSRYLRKIDHELSSQIREARSLQTAIDQHSIVSVTDTSGIINFANEKFCELSGYSAQELVGNSHKLVNSGHHDKSFFSNMWETISAGEVWHGEICNRNKNGKTYWVKSTIVPFLDDEGLPYQYISIRTDITHFKLSEQLATKKQKLLQRQQNALFLLSKDNQLAESGIDAALITILKYTSEVMHADRVSIWQFAKDRTALTCKSKYLSSHSNPLITDELNLENYPNYVKCLEKQFVVNSPYAKTDKQTLELYETYLAPSNIYSKLDVALHIDGKLCGVLFIESCEQPAYWENESEVFARTISDIISQRFAQHSTLVAKQALLESEYRLRRSQEYANIGTWDLDIESGKLFWSERVATLFGYKESIPETTYETFYSAIHPEDRQYVIDSLKGSIEHGKDYNIEHRILTEDGEVRWLASQGNVTRNENNEPLNMLCVVQDISKRKTLEENVNRQKSLLDIIRIAITEFVDSLKTKNVANIMLPELLKLTNSEFGFIGIIQYDNQNNPTLKTQAIKDSLSSLNDMACQANPISKSPVFSQISTLMNITINQNEMVISNSPENDIRNNTDKSLLDIKSYLGIPIIYGDEIIGMFGLANRPEGYDNDVINFLQPFTLTYGVIIHAQQMAIQDIKQREDIIKSREAAEKANRAKSLFLSNMSHELRTPLNAILGFTQLLSMPDPENPLNESQYDSVKEVTIAGEHLLALINDILDLSKVETGIIELEVVDVDLDTLLDECINLLTPIANENNISLNFKYSALTLRTDQKRLKQIILNLVSNAIKYNKPEGKVELYTSTTSTGLLKISVKDTGIGIAEEDQKDLFKSFKRINAEDSTIPGTGIGLVIAKNMTEILGGSMYFSSECDQGSKFWIEIPMQLEVPIAITQHNEELTPDNATMGNTILILEENETHYELTTQLFERRPNINLLNTQSEELALLIIAENENIDLIILNTDADQIDAKHFCSRLKQNPRTEHIPVIAMGTNQNSDYEKEVVAMGYNAFLSKPIDVNSFFSIVDQILSN